MQEELQPQKERQRRLWHQTQGRFTPPGRCFESVCGPEASTKTSTRCNKKRELPSAVPSASPSPSQSVSFDHAQPPEPHGSALPCQCCSSTARIYHSHSHLQQLLGENGKRSPPSSPGDPLRQKLQASIVKMDSFNTIQEPTDTRPDCGVFDSAYFAGTCLLSPLDIFIILLSVFLSSCFMSQTFHFG